MNSEVSIRPIRIEDAEEIVSRLVIEELQNYSYFEEAQAKREPVTAPKERDWIAARLANPNEAVFTIVVDGRIIGSCGLHEIDRANRNARISVMLFSKNDRGRRLGYSAMRLLMLYGIEVMGLFKIYLTILGENNASFGFYNHLGFKFEAHLRKHYFLGGQWHDMKLMSIFADEWMKEK